MTSLAPLLQAFFTDRLMTQRQASPNTIASYRDTFKLLLAHVQDQTGKAPSKLEISDLDSGTVTGFLTYLETVREIASAPATPVWLRFIRCSPTPHCVIPNTRR